MEILRKRGCWPPPRSLPRPITRGQLGPAACWRVQGTVRARNVVAGEVLSLLQQWYTSSMNVVCTWLTDRMDLQLHIYQLKTLIRIVKKTYRDFRLQGVLDSTLNSKTYETIRNRLTVEEATASVSEGGGLQGITMKDSDEEDEEDD
uniref:MUN domain-containing protein n=1 Tax=Anas zonorhyncha TaxID=75864 RepID=A0A8B9UZ74_9AVES